MVEFSTIGEFRAWAAAHRQEREAIESYIVGRDQLQGYCSACRKVQTFNHVGVGASWSDLRENILCSCGLNGRMRMLFELCETEFSAASPRANILLFEQVTPLFHRLQADFPWIRGCEYVSPDMESGSELQIGSRLVRHEDMCRTSISGGSMDLVFHADVLEHVPDWRGALRENARILRRGGKLIFTTPAFDIAASVDRAGIRNGELIHHLPPAYHGNPMTEQGSLVFTDFAVADLLDLREFGFSKSSLFLQYDPFKGIVSNNNPHEVGHMWPIAFVGTK